MVTIVGVQFQKNGKIYNYETGSFDLRPGDYIICDTSHGPDLGQVVIGSRQIDTQESGIQLKKVIRAATEKDLQISSENRNKEREAFSVCQKKIAEHKLDMKLVSVEYSFDNSKAMFYFTANGRVDFRSLVKDLAAAFKMRIELRQIGVRDEARMIGGLGPCGRQICCGAFLDEFQPVSIKMAKEQNLSLNPTKISGVCGRLMCCLKYEQEHYEQTRKIMPRIGREVKTPDGTGTVSDLNIVKETVFVRIANGDTSEIKEYPLEEIEKTGTVPSKPDNSCSENEENIILNPENTISSGKDEMRESQPAGERSNGELRKNSTEKGTMDSGSRRNERNQGKEREQRHQERQNRLGKPVLRENPNRTKPEQNIDAGKKSGKTDNYRKDSSEKKPENKPAEKNTGKSSSWSEAVRKAMESIQ